MAAVLQEIGYADAVLARQGENGVLHLIDGHLRAGMTPDTEVPVLILDVNEAEAEKILATLDPLAGMAEMDPEAWASLLGEIEFELPEFGALLDSLQPRSRGAVEGEDDVPAPSKTPASRVGDLWILGLHRFLCGDSTAQADVSRLLAGVEPGLMITDPPYGVNYRPEWRNEAARAGKVRYAARREGQVQNDDRADWSEAWALFPGAIVYVWHASLLGGLVGESLERNGFELRSQIVWAKSRFAISRGHYHWQHECCLYAVRKGKTAAWKGDRTQTTLWQIAVSQNEEARNDHGTQKPVECMRRPILNHTDVGQSVYDPFMGSGTTLIAAETTGRVCYGIDVDPVYVDVAVKRWQEFTGQAAVLDKSGKSFNDVTEERNAVPSE